MGVTKLFAAPYVDEVKLFTLVDRDIEGLDLLGIEKCIEESNDMYRKTALMYRYVERKNIDFIQRVNEYEISTVLTDRDIKVIVVPGMFYKEHPEVGARGDIVCEIARECGF